MNVTHIVGFHVQCSMYLVKRGYILLHIHIFFEIQHEPIKKKLLSMSTCINIIRWIYYGTGTALHRMTFEGLEHQLLVDHTARPVDIKIGMFSYKC